MRNCRRSWARCARALLTTTGALAATASAGTAASITGVCPDGSVYIVQHESQIPCARSKQVDPSEVPPLRPEYLPKPYTWQVWNERHNPNNPYNLVDPARQVRGMEVPQVQGSEGAAAGGAPGASATPQVAAGPPSTAEVAREPVGPLDLGLADDELRALYQIVELSQERAPARISRRTADGRGVFEVSFARSDAFAERLQDAWRSRGGLEGRQVLVFSAQSKRPEAFYANFTFVQGHLTYQPDREAPRQMGILQGRLGELGAGEVVLGYVVLPDNMDLGQDMDVYWNDRHATVHFEG